jgi:hypothetical protein
MQVGETLKGKSKAQSAISNQQKTTNKEKTRSGF